MDVWIRLSAAMRLHNSGEVVNPTILRVLLALTILPALLNLGFVEPARAQAGTGPGYVTTEVGAPGGNGALRYMCPADMFLAEIEAKVGEWMASAKLRCVPFDANLHWVGEPVDGPIAGGSGGDHVLHYGCGPNEVIAAYAATLVHVSGGGDYVAYVSVTCLNARTGTVPRYSGGPLSNGTSGSLQYSTVGDEQIGGTYGCPAGWGANGLAIRTGDDQDIDRFGLVCALLPIAPPQALPSGVTTVVTPTPETPPSVPSPPPFRSLRSVSCPAGMVATSLENRWTNVRPNPGYQSYHDDLYQLTCSRLSRDLRPIGTPVTITDLGFGAGLFPASAVCGTGQWVTTIGWRRSADVVGYSPLDVNCLDGASGKLSLVITHFLFDGFTFEPRLWSQTYWPSDSLKCQFPEPITGVELRDYGNGFPLPTLLCAYVAPPSQNFGIDQLPGGFCQSRPEICASLITCREVINPNAGKSPAASATIVICSDNASSDAPGRGEATNGRPEKGNGCQKANRSKRSSERHSVLLCLPPSTVAADR